MLNFAKQTLRGAVSLLVGSFPQVIESRKLLF
jgi:hypothetical protein